MIGADLAPVPLAEAEQIGDQFAAKLGAKSLAALRAMPAEQILEAGGQAAASAVSRSPSTATSSRRTPVEIFAAGEQAHVPLLVGWNSEEMNGRAVLGADEPTPESFAKVVRGCTATAPTRC